MCFIICNVEKYIFYHYSHTRDWIFLDCTFLNSSVQNLQWTSIIHPSILNHWKIIIASWVEWKTTISPILAKKNHDCIRGRFSNNPTFSGWNIIRCFYQRKSARSGALEWERPIHTMLDMRTKPIVSSQGRNNGFLLLK